LTVSCGHALRTVAVEYLVAHYSIIDSKLSMSNVSVLALLRYAALLVDAARPAGK